MAEKKHQLTALGIAYEAVIKLGYTHSKLARLDSSINYPTLRNIRDGKEMKKATERFYLKLFSTLLIRNMNGEWPVGATEPSACLS